MINSLELKFNFHNHIYSNRWLLIKFLFLVCKINSKNLSILSFMLNAYLKDLEKTTLKVYNL